MSGIEVGGIVLAILVNGLSNLADAVEKTRKWRSYRVRLEDYAITIKSAEVSYLNTLEVLLADFVQFDDEINALLGEPGGDIWKNPKYAEKLSQRLGRSYLGYFQTLDKLRNALNAISEKLGVDSTGRVDWDDSRLRSRVRRVLFTFSENAIKEALQTVHEANRELLHITQQSQYLEPMRQKRRSKSRMADLRLVRKHAISLYQAFITGKVWKCGCTNNHMASLRLESRPVALEEVNIDAASDIRFRILLSKQERDRPWAISECQEVEVIPSLIKKPLNDINVGLQTISMSKRVRFSPESASIPTEDLSQRLPIRNHCGSIVDLCSTLCASNEHKKAIGFIMDLEDDDHKHHLHRIDTTDSSEAQSKSLCDLLSSPCRESPKDRLLRGDRLRIAVTLASSVLQLYGTSWLKSQWSSNDILFHESNTKAKDQNHSSIYLSWKLCKEDRSPPCSFPCRNHTDRIEILLALGLTLVELCFGKTLAEMYDSADGGPNEEIMRINTACRMLGSVDGEMGIPYGDAVRRCLYQPFDVRDMDLDNEELQQKVFDGIVNPLIENLNYFRGKTKIH